MQGECGSSKLTSRYCELVGFRLRSILMLSSFVSLRLPLLQILTSLSFLPFSQDQVGNFATPLSLNTPAHSTRTLSTSYLLNKFLATILIRVVF